MFREGSTMKQIGVIALLLLALSGPFASTEAASYGAGLTLKKVTPISQILAAPDQFVGQKVQVRGLIVDVCESRGCWMSIAGDQPFQQLRFKVTDGDMVFPLTARGKTAIVEGILQKFVLSREEVIERRKHHAEEQGERFDPASVTAGETFYQLRGLGAVIEGL